jgi:apolipoprotein N-acyltransferase
VSPAVKKRILFFIPPILSGALTGIALLFFKPWLAWFMLVPLYYSVLSDPIKSFYKGSISGIVAGLFLFSWMISSARYYTGTSSYIGISLWAFSTVYFGLITGFGTWMFSYLAGYFKTRKNLWWVNSILAGAIWVAIDWIRTRIMPGVPWLHYQYAVTQSPFNTMLQLVSFTGIFGLTFVVVFINSLFSNILIEKKYKRLWLPFAVFCGLLLIGSIRLGTSEERKFKKIDVAIICENAEARSRWLPETGDSLAGIFFDLNRQAVMSNPQLIIWSESAIPWDLSTDDDLLLNCLAITWVSRAGHIVGVFSPSDELKGKRYNSAYYVEPDGAITSRYDKVQLLSFLEEPFLGAKLPFFNRSAHTDIIPGKERRLLKTPYGNAGILICNETLAPLPFKETIKLGADFFVVMSNNSWFEGSRLNRHHFYYNRIRAVESGVDMIINCNRGISGIINANGTIQKMDNSGKPATIPGYIKIQKHKSFYAQYNDWFVILISIFLIAYILYAKYRKFKR